MPKALPSLLRAHEIGSRVAAVGFDWPDSSGVVDKIDEEVRELREALAESPARAAEEMGDLLFSIANLARKLKIDPESALRMANDKFSERFAALEDDFDRRGATIHGASLDEMEAAWQRVKKAKQAPAKTTKRAKAPRARTAARGARSRPKASPRARRSRR